MAHSVAFDRRYIGPERVDLDLMFVADEKQWNGGATHGGVAVEFRGDNSVFAATATSPPPVIEQLGGRDIAPVVIVVSAAGDLPSHAVGGQRACDRTLRHGDEPREEPFSGFDVTGRRTIGGDSAT